MTLSGELTWRGLVSQSTLDDITELDKKKFTLYLGVDPSADSVTIGNLAVIMMVRRFLDYGHKVVLLVGGGTGVIGDPGGKSEERNLQTLEQIAINKKGIESEYKRIFAGQDFTLVDNYDWLSKINMLDFLRDVGKHFGMSTLVQREFIANRIGKGGNGISYTEFSYTLLQGYDFWHLNKNFGVDLQIGASDQWGNFISGIDYIRKRENKTVHAFACPLVIDNVTGKKFGKSEGNAIWLSPNKTSVFDFYQFWLNTDDEGCKDYIKIYTLLSKDEIEDLIAQAIKEPAKRIVQKALAYEVTKLVHGADKAEEAKRASERLFGSARNIGAEVSALTPSFEVAEGVHEVADLLLKSGLVASKSAASRLLLQGGIKLNQQKVESDKVVIKKGDLLQVGKRRVVKIV